VRLFLLARHGESALNVERRVNGDPEVQVDLTDRGREESEGLGEQIAHLAIDLCVRTPFVRTEQTAAIALEGRDVAIASPAVRASTRRGCDTRRRTETCSQRRRRRCS
jgi:broad specificity phosphatase PhoE